MQIRTLLLPLACVIVFNLGAQDRISASSIDRLPTGSYDACIRAADSLLKVYDLQPFVIGNPGDATAQDGLTKIDQFYKKALVYKPGDPYAIAQSDKLTKRGGVEAIDHMEIQYRKIITRGDEYFNRRDYLNAKVYYERALTFKPNDPYPKKQLYNCDRLLAADDLFNKKDYTKARERYRSLLKDLPKDTLIAERIAETDLLIRCATTPITDEIFQKIVRMADDFYSKKNYAKAKEYYDLALRYRGGDVYSKNRQKETAALIEAEKSTK